ncbi:Two-component response regulator, AmiR/NasT family, consists of REC and RNA-binding antiterminator (ANTAR) domains [Limimonas halophila]|uniref:Two-component response regulator, AmiR/NasT family, consists of REC and RNA-binding antiterminator (ANTAR) domains n=1 Tax=Limimonas halophila TaxID=1082479 RepID=A0A1G7LI42_9PROT|nr:response regulator [Limimonas halophila]SDF49113.1 Two-component response regulator, AmiR/NasT family, consists of REC and RNA-binding antiterminator (ANTAR) domains [Limimonas halophila]
MQTAISTAPASTATTGESRPRPGYGGPAHHGTTRVLVVEDERLTALDLATRVKRMGYTVIDRIAETAAEAVSLTRETRPDVVLMDVRLKGEGDGIEAARTIERLPSAPGLVYVTAYSNADTVAQLRATACVGWCVKPVDTGKLETLLSRAVRHRGTAFTNLERRIAGLAVAGLSVQQIALATDLGKDEVLNLLPNLLRHLRAQLGDRDTQG